MKIISKFLNIQRMIFPIVKDNISKNTEAQAKEVIC